MVNQIHYRDRDIKAGQLTIDRPINEDLIIVADTLISAAESGRKFLPVIRVNKVGYLARHLKWWPFGRKFKIHVKEIINVP